jgi:hypothetical protein
LWDPDPFATVQASVKRPVTPPSAGPCDPPLICVQFNQEYLPFVAGALSQWTQREAFLAATEDDLQLALANFTWLIEIIGTAVQCSQPPLIPGQPTTERACNISGYLANYIIKESVSQGINAVGNGLSIVTFVWGVVRFVPGFAEALPLTWLAMNGLLAAISAFGTGPFQTAVDDPTLFPAITCAIYQAILGDGQVTPANFPTIQSNIAALTFASADVKATIEDFITNLGASGLLAVQTGGVFAAYDCTGCGTGPALGPVGPSPWRLSGKNALQILVGAGEAVLAIAFPQPFDTPPLLTASTDIDSVVASFESTSATGTTLRITSAVPVGATMTANVDWTASLPGTS